MQKTTRSRRNAKVNDDLLNPNGNKGNNNTPTNNIDIDAIKKEKKKVNPKKADQANDTSKIDQTDLKKDIDMPTNSASQMLITGIKKGDAVVDSKLANASDYHVIADTANIFNGRCFDCTMNQSDLKNNNNKFYIIQLLALDKEPNKYSLWTRWGRVGYDGQNSKSEYNNLDKAINEFMKKYNDKIKGGYTPLVIDYSNEKEEKKQIDQKESSLPKSLQNLLQLIYNINIMNEQMAEIGYDAKKMPLGKLGKETLKKGYDILKEIEAVIKGSKSSITELNNLSSKFYSLIPHDFGFQKMQNFVIKDIDMLKKKIELVESLSDIQIATKILEETRDTNDIIDQYYKRLECDISPLNSDTIEFQMIQGYLDNTSNFGVTIQDAFIINKKVEHEQFLDVGNKMLLWHGSRITNFVGILSKGLRIAPPEAPVSGYLFGKGIYFADMAAKSLCYCYPSNKIGCILLCEVSLGTPNELMTTDCNASNLPQGKHCTKGCGQTAPPIGSYKDLNGIKVPFGKGERTDAKSYLGFNEYIVYDVRQVKLKYLLKLKWK